MRLFIIKIESKQCFKISAVYGRKKKEKKLSSAALIIAICGQNVISLYLSVFVFSDRRQYDHASKTIDVKDETINLAGNPSEAELALLCPRISPSYAQQAVQVL